MKLNKIFALVLGVVALASCADFEEINHNPKAVNAADAKPYWALNKSIVADQQNPNDAERVFVLYWADIARQDGENGGRSCGRSNDEWAGCLYNLTKNCITSANNAINLVDEQIASLTGHEAELFPNVKAAARIWRVYLMTEFVDSFGSFTTDFTGTTPVYESVEDCYKFMFNELAEAVAAINTSDSAAASSDAEKNGDPAYQLDPLKWKNFGISMWMRIAMRLSEVDEATAKAEFGKAIAAGTGIITTDGTFRVKEDGGWNDLSGVMSRTWDWQQLSATMANLTTNLGGAKAEDVFADKGGRFYKSVDASRYTSQIKDASKYLGVEMASAAGKDYEVYTDNPTQGFFFDGIPSYIDPRGLAYYCIPGDYNNRKETGYCNFMAGASNEELAEMPVSKNGEFTVNANYAWNGLVCGWSNDDKVIASNALIDPNAGYYGVTYPSLQERYRNNSEYRVFFGPWETYFLMAEAAVRGWISTSAEASYNNGIKASFEYLGLGAYADDYINSENYNRVGTSVKFSHTAEPANFEIEYVDPTDGSTKTKTYEYPVASKTLYGKALNDQLCKIITQKYIANCPYLPLESWSDHRRLGLPFWEIPVSSTEFPFLDNWTKDSYKNGQKPGYYAQRMNYPAKFNNASPEEYKHAIELMGMTAGENTITPLWWAKH